MTKTIGLISANYLPEENMEIVETRALAALPFGGRYRLIDFPLSNFMNSGIQSVGLIMPFNNRSLIDHVGTGKSWGFGRKSHSLFLLPGKAYGRRDENSKFLLRDLITNSRFLEYENEAFVLMCGSNNIFSMDFRPLIAAHEKSAAKITRVYKKNKFLDCFIMDLSFIMDIIKWFSNFDYMDINEIIDRFLPETEVGHYEFDGYFCSINSLADYFKANMDLLKEEVQEALFESAGDICTNIQDRCPTYFAPSAKVKNSVVAAGCTIEGTVENSIIFRSSNIKKGAVVKNSVLLQHAEIGEKAKLKYFVCDKRVLVKPGVVIEGSRENPCFAKKGTVI